MFSASLCILDVLLVSFHHASCLFLIKTSSDWSRGFSSCYHSKMGKHIAKSSSLTAFSLRLFVGLFNTLLVGVRSLVVSLLQCLDICCHDQNLFLFIRWCSPGIVLTQQPCFILVFSHCHEFFSIVGCSSIINLTLLVLDVCDEVFIWSSC